MRILGIICVILGALSILLAIVSRFTANPIGMTAVPVTSRAFGDFATAVLLLGIALTLLEKKK